MVARSAVTLALATMLAAGCASGGSPRFRPASGWHLLSRDGELVAANVEPATADRALASPPTRTVATLPRHGIVIWASLSPLGRRYPPASTPLPLRLGESLPSNPFEGFGCAPAVPRSRCYSASGSVRRLVAQDDGYHVDLYVFFGTDRPAAASVTAANAELARLRFPHQKTTRTATPVCPARWGPGAYDTTLSSSAGPAGSTVVVSGALGVIGEDGTYGGQTATHVDAYWNLSFRKWWTVSTRPKASVAGSPVRHLARQDVAGRCGYRVRITIPSVPPGRYPIEVLSANAEGEASFAPVNFEVTAG